MQRKFVCIGTTLEEMASIVSILSCGQRSGERCTKEGFATSHRGVQELYETLSDPGPSVEFAEDTATDFEKTVRTLNAYFVTKLNEPYERHVFRSMAHATGRRNSWSVHS